MSYCPDCGGNALKIKVSNEVSCPECNFRTNFIGYLNRFHQNGVSFATDPNYVDETKFKVKISPKMIEATGQFFQLSDKLTVILETADASKISPLIGLLGIGFENEILIQVHQRGVDPLLNQCPLCHEEIFYLSGDDLVCFDCCRFRVSIQDYLAGQICNGHYQCKSVATLAPNRVHSYLNYPLQDSFYVFAKSPETTPNTENAFVEVKIRINSDAPSTVIAIRPITADARTLNEIEALISEARTNIQDTPKPINVKVIRA